MKVIQTEIHDALILEPKVFGDARGFFLESYNKRVLAEAAGIRAEFVQDNHSRSARGVLRGLHYQLRQPQGKLVRVASGTVFDVAVDIRRSSPTFGKVACVELSEDQQSHVLAAAGPRPRLPRRLRIGGFPLQDHRLLRAGARALHPLERCRAGDSLAADRRAEPLRQGSQRCALRRGGAVSVNILLTGKNGQVGWELQRTLQPVGKVAAFSHAGLDLADAAAMPKQAG
jgi:hypothetical protein